VILHGAGNNFRGRGGIVVHENDERNGVALVAPNALVDMLLGSAAVVRNYNLVFLEEHVAYGNRFIEQAAGITAHVQHETVEIGSV